MTKILLTRHGHVEGIKPERFRGREQLELTSQGHNEARMLARRIAGGWKPIHLYTSPMERSVQTARAVAEACGLADATPLEKFNDINYGAWQFKTFAAAKVEDPGLFAAWFATPQMVRFPSGESLQDVAARTADTLRLVLSRHPNDAVVLVGHDSVNRVLLLQLLELPLSSYWLIDQSPCCVNEIDVADGTVRVLQLNDTYHLSGPTE